MWRKIKGFVFSLSPLRIMLMSTAIIMIFFPASPTADMEYHGWKMLTTLMVPVFVPMVALVLLLDALMARVVMGEYQGETRKHYRTIILVDLLLALLLVAAWFPFFAAIMGSG